MSNHRARLLTVAAAGLLGVAAVAGCSSKNTSSDNMTGMTTRIGAISASQLRAALLTRVNGTRPATKPEAGSYWSLPAIQSAAKQLNSLQVTPKQCALQGIVLGTGALGNPPAAVVNFKVGTNGVSEVLAAPPNNATVASLVKPIPPGCSQYTVMSKGKPYHFATQQFWVKGIGLQAARVLNIRGIGTKGSLWSVLYQGSGFIGSITIDGPNATEADARQLATQSYDYAAKVLP